MANVATELYKYYTSVGEDQKSGDQKRTNKRKRISPVLPIADSGPKEKESDAKRIPAGALVEILTNPTSVNPVGVGLRFAKRRKVKTKNSDNDSKEKKDKEKNKERKQREEQKEKEKEVHVVDEDKLPLVEKEQRVDGPPIWGIDNHLALLTVVSDYLKIYRKHVWALNPLHPAVFDESNIEYYLISPEGLQERSSMALNFNVALMFGCLLTGDSKVTAEFYMQAQQQLDYLCQYTHTTTDYSIALAVTGLAYFTLYVQLEVFESAKLISLAMAICKRINAMNSDVYVRCLLSLSLHPMRNYEILKNITQEVENAKDLPYYPLVALSFLEKKAGYTTQGVSGRPSSSPPPNQLPVSLQNLKTIASATKVAANVLALLFMATELSLSAPLLSASPNDTVSAASMSDPSSPSFAVQTYPMSPLAACMSPTLLPDIGMSPTAPPEAFLSPSSPPDLCLRAPQPTMAPNRGAPPSPPPQHPMPTSAELSDLSQLISETEAFEEFLQIVEALAQQIFSVQQNARDPLPFPVECWFSLLTNALAAKCNLHLGRRTEAFKHANQFLAEAKKPKSCYVIFAGDYISLVLEVFVQLQRYDCIHDLMDAIEPWACLIPATRKKKEDIMMLYGLGVVPSMEEQQLQQQQQPQQGRLSELDMAGKSKKEELIDQLESEREKMLKIEEKMHWMEQVMLSLRKDLERRRAAGVQLEQQLHLPSTTPTTTATTSVPPTAPAVVIHAVQQQQQQHHPAYSQRPDTVCVSQYYSPQHTHNSHHLHAAPHNNPNHSIFCHNSFQFDELDNETFLPPEVFHMPKMA